MTDTLTKISEDELTCIICTDIFKSPVQLPCQHSFCRECLKKHISSDVVPDNGNAKVHRSEQSVGRKSVRLRHTSSCPVCQKPIQLDPETVCQLPVDITVVNKVEKYREVNKIDTPKCSMCEGDNPKTAIKGCVTCRCLYCQDCLGLMHPMRGPLSKHSLVAAKSYASTPVCHEHIEPLKVFCNDCKNLYCLMCVFEKHSGHDLKKPEVSFCEEKSRLATKISRLKEQQQQMSDCFIELSEMEEDIGKCFDGQVVQVEAKYEDILSASNNWKDWCVQSISKERGAIFKQTILEAKALEAQFSKSTTCLKSASDLAGQTDSIQFLLISEATIKTIDKISTLTTEALQVFKKSKQAIEEKTTDKKASDELLYLMDKRNGNGENTVEFRVILRPIQCPGFVLKKENHDCISVLDDGKLLVNVRTCSELGVLCGALADRSYQEERVYWETDITYTVKLDQKENSLVYSAGVLHQSKPTSLCLGIDRHSWGVTFQQKFPYSFVCGHTNLPCCSSPVHSDDVEAQTGTVRLGFYLDCSSKTLTILYCTQGRILHTFRGLDLSEPLTPAIAVYNADCIDVSVRLRTGQDIASLPPCLYDMLQGP